MLLSASKIPVFLFLLTILLAKSSSSNATQRTEVALNGDNSTGPYLISHDPIAMGSDSIWVDEVLFQKSENYSIDYDRGFIITSQPVPSSSTIRASYIAIYSRLNNPHYLYKPLSIDLKSAFPPDSSRPALQSEKPPSFYSPGLNIGGSKSLSIEFGSSLNPDINQALDLSIRGPVVRGVNATAFVSDRGIPVASGGTSTIEELDKFFINITAKNFSATLGDFYVDFNSLELARYNKKLKGLALNYDDQINQGSISASSSSGRFTVNRFNGREGDQGPYLLFDPSGSRSLTVLPGTETVFINGEKLTRGSDNDYVIDYQNAHITFTPKRLVTSDSRIEVEFEYSNREFSRGFYASRFHRSNREGRFAFGATVIAEIDDKNGPLSAALSDEDRQAIKDSGIGEYALKSGVEYKGPGQGEYNQAVDSTGYIYYLYVGPDSGEYHIQFSNLGYGKGDYTYIGRGIYSFVGVLKGDYAPVVKLPVPRSQYLYGFDGSFNPNDNVNFQIESAYTRNNRNLFLGDNGVIDDPALILRGKAVTKPSSSLLPDEVVLSGNYRHTARNFAPFAEFRAADYYNKWNLLPNYSSVTEDAGEGALSTSYGSRCSFDFEGGRLSRASEGYSDRWSAGAAVELPLQSKLHGNFRQSDHRSKADSLSSYFNLKGTLQEFDSQYEFRQWLFKPSLGYKFRNNENYENEILRDGVRYNIYETGLAFYAHKRITNTVTYSLQRDDEYAGKWLRKDEAITLTEQIALADIPAGLTLNYEYTFRNKRFKEIAGTNSRQNLSYLTSGFNSGPFSIEYNHKYNRMRAALKIRRYILVDEGTGDYSYENGEYVLDPFGNYISVLEEAGDFRPISEVENAFFFKFDGRRAKDDSSYLRQFKSETSLDFNQRSEETGIKFVDMINPWRNMNPALLVSEQLRFIQDVYLLPVNTKIKREIRLRYAQTLIVASGGSFESDFDDKRSAAARLRQSLGKGFSLEAEYTREHRLVAGIAELRMDSDLLVPDITFTPNAGLEIGSGLKYRRDREVIDEFTVILYSLLPHIRWNFSQKGRFDFNAEIIRVLSPDAQFFNYRIAEGNRAGENFRLTVRGLLRLGENSVGELTYNFRKRPDEKAMHLARVEVKYNF